MTFNLINLSISDDLRLGNLSLVPSHLLISHAPVSCKFISEQNLRLLLLHDFFVSCFCFFPFTFHLKEEKRYEDREDFKVFLRIIEDNA
jgi:hypothetical protein